MQHQVCLETKFHVVPVTENGALIECGWTKTVIIWSLLIQFSLSQTHTHSHGKQNPFGFEM